MSAQAIIKKFSLLIELIDKRHYPDKDEIMTFIEEEGIKFSYRSLKRHIEQLKYEYGVHVEYNTTEKGYFINKELTTNIESFYKFLELTETADLIKTALTESQKQVNCISFARKELFRGKELLSPLLDAILKNRKISFDHVNYGSNTLKPYKFKPTHLREYNNRWYLCGHTEEDLDRVIGVDRIENLKVSTEHFKPHKDDFYYYFEDTIGVNYGDIETSTPEEIIFEVNSFGAKYLESHPLHKSQKVIKESKNKFTLSIKVIVNNELFQQILMRSDLITVISPKHFREKLKLNYLDAAKRYS